MCDKNKPRPAISYLPRSCSEMISTRGTDIFLSAEMRMDLINNAQPASAAARLKAAHQSHPLHFGHFLNAIWCSHSRTI